MKKLTVEQELESELELERDIYRSDLFLTAKDLLGYSDLTWATHGEMICALEAPTRRKLIVMPRGTFKSSICSVAYPIWLLLRNPNERILIDSELFRNSRTYLREIKNHLTSPRVAEMFGDLRGEPWSDSEATISTRTAIFKEASITATGIGAEKTGYHASCVIHDDMNSPSNSNTDEGRRNVINHYRMNTSILNPDGTMVVVATRYHQLDLPGFVLSNEINTEKTGLLEKRV